MVLWKTSFCPLTSDSRKQFLPLVFQNRLLYNKSLAANARPIYIILAAKLDLVDMQTGMPVKLI